jgi:hypothetical protein
LGQGLDLTRLGSDELLGDGFRRDAENGNRDIALLGNPMGGRAPWWPSAKTRPKAVWVAGGQRRASYFILLSLLLNFLKSAPDGVARGGLKRRGDRAKCPVGAERPAFRESEGRISDSLRTAVTAVPVRDFENFTHEKLHG